MGVGPLLISGEVVMRRASMDVVTVVLKGSATYERTAARFQIEMASIGDDWWFTIECIRVLCTLQSLRK